MALSCFLRFEDFWLQNRAILRNAPRSRNRLIIRHQGTGITQEQAAAQADARSREEGGHGLALVRRVFSHVHFSTDDERGSEIVLEKAL